MATERSRTGHRIRHARQVGPWYSPAIADMLETLIRELPRRHALLILDLVEQLEGALARQAAPSLNEGRAL